jgi:DNA-binding IclR family transcriptional regulator
VVAGFAPEDFSARTGLAVSTITAPLTALLARGLLERTAAGYRPSELGLRFLNDLVVEFMTEMPEMSDAFALSIAAGGGARDGGRPLFTGAVSPIGE